MQNHFYVRKSMRTFNGYSNFLKVAKILKKSSMNAISKIMNKTILVLEKNSKIMYFQSNNVKKYISMLCKIKVYF